MKYLLLILLMVSCGKDEQVVYSSTGFEVNKCYFKNRTLHRYFKVVKKLEESQDDDENDSDDDSKKDEHFIFKYKEGDEEYLSNKLWNYTIDSKYTEVECSEVGL